ncbi:MAG TPA: YXWGXW repeat-containing protein [Alphaproteobacteria bacterium]|nr:YXWGXW repeat-containing protein [Alphaproteobacteria bacterium]
MRLSPYYIPVILGLAFAVPTIGASAQVAVGIGLTVPLAPPPLPIYAQPPIPAAGYLWTPGYWHYHQVGGYYWIPGTWVRPPSIGLLWTPPYWGYRGGVYAFNAGYWGPHVGFYGGINYGFGYGGVGYGGGEWRGGAFAYNRAANNFGRTHIDNVYNRTIINNRGPRTSFNGGAGGIQARANAQDEAFAREQHVMATAEQRGHEDGARGNLALRASENHGRPGIAATAKAGDFEGRDAVRARAAGRDASHPRAYRAAGGVHPEHPAHPAHPEHPAHPAAARDASAPHGQQRIAADRRGAARNQHAPAAHPAAARAEHAEAGHKQGGNDKQH